MSGWLDWVSDGAQTVGVSNGIAGASFLVSLGVLARQRWLEGKAHLILEHETPSEMILINLGPGAGRNVKVTFEERQESNSTIDYLAPGQTYRFMTPTMGWGETEVRASLSWRDGRWRTQQIDATPGAPPGRFAGTSSKRRSGVVDAAVQELVEEELDERAAEAVRNYRSRSRIGR